MHTPPRLTAVPSSPSPPKSGIQADRAQAALAATPAARMGAQLSRSAIGTGHAIGGNGGREIAVALSGATPTIIDEAHAMWLPKSVPQLFVGDTEDSARSLWHVERQDELRRAWSNDHNHASDNRPLRLVQLANRTLWGRFGFMALGDLDTCFNLEKMQRSLALVDPNQRLYLGLPFNENYSYRQNQSSPGCARRQGGECCTLVGNGSHECRPPATPCNHGDECSLKTLKPGMGLWMKAPAWGFGGAGVVLSRGLLSSIDERDWLRCYKRINKYGSDVRVANCIYALTGVGLTFLPGLLRNLSSHKACLSAAANQSIEALRASLPKEEPKNARTRDGPVSTVRKPGLKQRVFDLISSGLGVKKKAANKPGNKARGKKPRIGRPQGDARPTPSPELVHGSSPLNPKLRVTGATGDCLQLRRAPPKECSSEWTHDGCLQSAMPARIPHATVESCFRCCLLASTAPLKQNSRFWRNVWLHESLDPWGKGSAGRARGAVGQKLGFDADNSVLLSPLSGVRYADVGSTYSNSTLLHAPLSRGQPRPYFTCIYGWNSASQLALQKWNKVRPRAHNILYTPGAQALPEAQDLQLLESPAGHLSPIRKWWVTNPSADHPRLAAFPRGIQSSTRWQRVLRSPGFARQGERRTLLFCSCITLTTHSERPKKIAALRANGFVCEPQAEQCRANPHKPESDYYVRQLLDARFTASPRGAGQQTHRDWEARPARPPPLARPRAVARCIPPSTTPAPLLIGLACWLNTPNRPRRSAGEAIRRLACRDGDGLVTGDAQLPRADLEGDERQRVALVEALLPVLARPARNAGSRRRESSRAWAQHERS